MIGGLLSLLSAVIFAYANASVRRGVLTGTVLQAVAISLPVALPFFILAMLVSGGFAALAGFSGRSLALLALAGIVHFALARYCSYRATKAIGANLVAPVQQFSLVISLVLAVVWLGEPITVLRMIGIALVVAGPALTLGPEKKKAAAVPPETAGETTAFNPQYAEGYFYALLSALGFGISPIMIGMAFETKDVAVGIAGGFVSYAAATIAIALPLLLPGQWKSFRTMDRGTAKWFVISGIAVCMSQMFRYMALAIAPVSVVTPAAERHIWDAEPHSISGVVVLIISLYRTPARTLGHRGFEPATIVSLFKNPESFADEIDTCHIACQHRATRRVGHCTASASRDFGSGVYRRPGGLADHSHRRGRS